MSKLLLALALAVLLIAMLAIFLHRRSVRQVMQRMEHMLDAAMDGSFRESAFDETQLSRLESKLARYLTANEVSADHLASERDKIRTLISDISHQTKTPIANLRLYTELLQEESLPNSAAQAVTQLQRQTEKLSFLITSLVKLSRLETGILTVHPEPHPLDTLLADLAEQYTPAAAAKGLAFSAASTALPPCRSKAASASVCFCHVKLSLFRVATSACVPSPAAARRFRSICPPLRQIFQNCKNSRLPGKILERFVCDTKPKLGRHHKPMHDSNFTEV